MGGMSPEMAEILAADLATDDPPAVARPRPQRFRTARGTSPLREPAACALMSDGVPTELPDADLELIDLDARDARDLQADVPDFEVTAWIVQTS